MRKSPDTDSSNTPHDSIRSTHPGSCAGVRPCLGWRTGNGLLRSRKSDAICRFRCALHDDERDDHRPCVRSRSLQLVIRYTSLCASLRICDTMAVPKREGQPGRVMTCKFCAKTKQRFVRRSARRTPKSSVVNVSASRPSSRTLVRRTKSWNFCQVISFKVACLTFIKSFCRTALRFV